jgi:hypothetical protein
LRECWHFQQQWQANRRKRNMEAPKTSKATELLTETRNFVIIIRWVEYCKVILQGTLHS